jgi:small multidrug resistance family-3 protein
MLVLRGVAMNYVIFIAAALCEIAGCFAFWAWWRLDKSALWLAPGAVALIAFGWLLAMVTVDAAGRAYAAYGGIYIVASLAWMGLVERFTPDRYDVLGACLCLVGATVMIAVPR